MKKSNIKWWLAGMLFIALLITKFQDRDDDDLSMPALETSHILPDSPANN